jgi:hypothetical protein
VEGEAVASQVPDEGMTPGLGGTAPTRRGSTWARTIAALLVAAALVLAAVLGALAVTGRLALPGRCAPADDACLRVLFVGNSYTYVNDLPTAFADLVRAGGRPVEVGMVATGGATLADHAASETTRSAIQDGKWSVVVLQEQSDTPASEAGRTAMFEPAVRSMAAAAGATGARTLLLETWAHRDGSPDLGLAGYAAMQARIDAAYEAAAAAVGASVAPAGSAWEAARVAGPGIALWQDDGSHPAPAGTYLAACVLYATVTGRTPVGLPTRVGVSPADAAILQRVAAETVLGDSARWRVPVMP